jgi:hypothetical protein
MEDRYAEVPAEGAAEGTIPSRYEGKAQMHGVDSVALVASEE